MGVLGDFGRLMKGASALPRPSFAQSIKMAADSVERIPEYQAVAAAAQSGYGAAGADPFANMAMMRSGVSTSATVLALRSTGERVDAATVHEVDLRVTDPQGGTSWDVVHRQLIAPAALANWQPGAVMPVRFDPTDRSRIVIG